MQYIDKLFIRRPGFLSALSFVAGIALGFTVNIEPAELVSCSMILSLISVMALLRKSRQVLNVAMSAMTFLAAMVYAGQSTAKQAEFRSSFVIGREADVLGIVVTDPDQWPTKSPRFITRQFKLSVIECPEPAGMCKSGQLDVKWHGYKSAEIPRYGQTWRVKGKICRDKYANGPNKAGYYLNSDMKSSVLVSENGGSRLFRKCYLSREICRKYLGCGISDFPVESGLLEAIVLGYRSTMPRDIKQTFVLTGTLHVFAISGSHVCVFAGLILGVINMLGVRKKHWVLVMGPMLVAYTIATGMQPSAVRACVMAVVLGIAPLLGRRPDVISSLAFSAVLILLYEPGQVYDIGFALSYGVVTGLVIVYPIFDRLIIRYMEPDELLAANLQERNSVMRSVVTSFLRLVAISFAAWLVSTPLTAYYFGLFSPVSLVANIAIVPLSFLVILSGCLSLVFGPFLPVIAAIFNHASVMVIWVMVKLSAWLSGLPHAYVQVEQGHALWPVMWLIVLFTAAVALRRKQSKA